MFIRSGAGPTPLDMSAVAVQSARLAMAAAITASAAVAAVGAPRATGPGEP